MAEVVLNSVSKVYPGGVKAVLDANLTIENGEFVVLVGPSGCGKTTTLRMIAGLEEITDGDISIAGKVVNDVPPKDRDIAMVFQNYALYPHMTVYKNMAFGLKLRKFKRKEIDRRVRETAQLLGLDELLNRKPKALSGGQRQRVAVGRAIVREPKAFLFDEPLSNLDAKLRGQMRAELKELHRRLQTTTIYVTHDQEEAMSLGDRIVVMHTGLIRQMGDPLAVYDHPEDRFVAGFVGTPPMNFLEGSLRGVGEKIVFDLGQQQLTLPNWMYSDLEPYMGNSMVLGIRPEHLLPKSCNGNNIAEEPKFRNGTLEFVVTVAEPLGNCQDVYMLFDNSQRIVARCDAHVQVSDGERVATAVDLDRIHVFEPGELGRNVIHKGKSNGVNA